MNDKEAAVLINDMLNKPDTFDDWQASTFYERMSSYIIRELGHRGETVSEWFLETEIANQIETIEDEVTTENNEVTENNNNAIVDVTIGDNYQGGIIFYIFQEKDLKDQ